MNYIFQFFPVMDLTWGSIIFIMVMSFFLAIFHTVIFSNLFNLDFNKKLFFVLNPVIIIACALVDFRLAVIAAALMFVSIFISAITGMFVAGFRDKTATKKEIQDFYKKYQLAPRKPKREIFSSLFILMIFAGFFYFGFIAMLLLVLLVIIDAVFFPSNKSRFLKYQAILPVSKIRSLAMGLVEVEGRLKTIKPLKSPLTGKDCIGFCYTIESVTRDDSGDDRYSTIFSETLCNRFFVEDDTGGVEINADKLEFVWINNITHKRSNGKRYTENLLEEGDKVILIGRASTDANNKTVIEFDSFRKVLAVAPVTRIDSFNTSKPFRHSLIFFACIYCILIALVLITPIEIDRDKIVVKKPDWSIFHFTSVTREGSQ